MEVRGLPVASPQMRALVPEVVRPSRGLGRRRRDLTTPRPFPRLGLLTAYGPSLPGLTGMLVDIYG